MCVRYVNICPWRQVLGCFVCVCLSECVSVTCNSVPGLQLHSLVRDEVASLHTEALHALRMTTDAAGPAFCGASAC